MTKLKDVAKILGISLNSAKRLFEDDMFQLTENGTIYLSDTGKAEKLIKSQRVISEANRWLDEDDRADDNVNDTVQNDKAIESKLMELRNCLTDIQDLLQGDPETAEYLDGIFADAVDMAQVILAIDAMTNGGMKDD